MIQYTCQVKKNVSKINNKMIIVNHENISFTKEKFKFSKISFLLILFTHKHAHQPLYY